MSALSPQQFGDFDQNKVSKQALSAHQTVGGYLDPRKSGKNFPHDMLDTYPTDHWRRIANKVGYGNQN